METRKLQHAVMLARMLNFTKAAEALNLTQSALSRSIQSLEDECQLRLFDRNRNVVAVTPVGREFLRHAEAMLRKETELFNMVNYSARGESGSIALGMMALAARTILAPLMTEMIKQPGFHADVTIGQPKRLFSLLIQETVEICVCTAIDLPASSPFAFVRIARMPLALIVRSDHPLTRSGRVGPADLEPFLMVRTRPYEYDSDIPSVVESMPQKRPALTVEDYDVLMRVTANSDAVWITSPVAARAGLNDGTLVQLPVTWNSPAPEFDMSAYYLKRRSLSPLGQRLLERMAGLGCELELM
jgi:DNA-binding transcriptional LysR family regulator